jgi:hypothetical protein
LPLRFSPSYAGREEWANGGDHARTKEAARNKKSKTPRTHRRGLALDRHSKERSDGESATLKPFLKKLLRFVNLSFTCHAVPEIGMLLGNQRG